MAERKFPGPVSAGLLKDAARFYATTTMGSRICVAGRDGAVLCDYDGFKFVDFHCDASVNNLGGRHEAILRAIRNQADTGNIFSEHHSAPNLAAVELAKQLTDICPVMKPAKVYFGNSGAEASETAVKLCKAARRTRGETTKQKTIYFKNSFHGRTLGVIAGTNSKPETQRDPFWDHCDRENTIYLPYPAKGTNPSLYRDCFSRLNTASIDKLFIELPCQGEGGIIPAREECVKEIYEFTRENDIFFIVDAIQCGMGRTGTLFGCDRWPWLAPDIINLGKALGGGIPIGATIFRADLDFTKPGMHSSTFGGGPLASRMALAVIPEIEHLISSGKIRELETNLQTNLTKLQKDFPAVISETRGIGAMWAHEIVSAEHRDRIIARCEDIAAKEEYGVRLLGAGRKAIRFMPPLNIPLHILNLGMRLYEKVLSSM